MKANIPSRIAFAVASAMESRLILDTAGAEKLVGRGDMLYAPLGEGKPKRVQGCFISSEEIERVVNFVKENGETDYDESVIDKINAADSNIFATEKQLKEYGDKLPADKKAAIETALGKLKEAHKNADVAAIDTALAELNAAWQAASQDIYAAQQQQGGAQQGAPHADAGAGTNGQQQGGSNQPEDVEFEEVK